MDKSRVPSLKRPWLRITFLAILVVLAVVVLAIIISRFGLNEATPDWSIDYLAYWGAARLLITGGNPYDAAELLSLQAAAGFDEARPIMLLNPPWTLALMLPFAYLPFGISKWLWLFTNIVIVGCCGIALWRYYKLPVRLTWLGPVLSILSFPTLWGFSLGQSQAWLLFGITGFLLVQHARRDLLAGVALALLFIKPHIAYFFLICVFGWALYERRWRVLFGSGLVLLIACLLVLCISPAVYAQYIRYIPGMPYSIRSATFSGLLNYVLGTNHPWIQYLPVMTALVASTILIIRRRVANISTNHVDVKNSCRSTWNWYRIAPWVLLVSALTAPYGWTCDKIILLPVIYAFLANWHEVPRWQIAITVIAYCGAQAVMYAVPHNTNGSDALNYFYPVLLTLLYAWQQIVLHRRSLKDGELIHAH